MPAITVCLLPWILDIQIIWSLITDTIIHSGNAREFREEQ